MSEHLLYVVRHGETDWSAARKHTGRTDVPLNADGQAQAAGVRGLPDGVVWSSPRQRALRTAELAGLRVSEVLDDLAEWDYGEYEGITTAQIRETVPDWSLWTHQVPGGESADEVTARADRVLARARNVDLDVVLVGHGHFGRVLISRWLGLPAAAGAHFALRAAGVAVLGYERGVAQLRSLD